MPKYPKIGEELSSQQPHVRFKGRPATGFGDGRRNLAVCPAGISRLMNQTEFLLQRVEWLPGLPPEGSGMVVVRAAPRPDAMAGSLGEELARRPRGGPAAIVVVGVGAAAGHLAGAVTIQDRCVPLAAITVVGPGMPRVQLIEEAGPDAPASNSDPGRAERWSRSIGALGEQAWRRLTALHIGIVGCGRTGSILAASLTRLGVRRLTLIDPDKLELHNLGEMEGVVRADVGHPKTEALASFLAVQSDSPGFAPAAVAESVFALPSLVSIKAADLLMCAVDNAAARIASAFLAKLYLKPMIDVGTGILHGRGPHALNAMGADVRLVLPDRCLHCFGGIAGFDQGRLAILAGSRGPAPEQDWRRQRAGSLRSLNQVAAGFALRLLEELLRGRLRECTWLQLDVDESGVPQLRHPAPAPVDDCPLCRVTGRGDDGASMLHSVLGEAEAESLNTGKRDAAPASR